MVVGSMTVVPSSSTSGVVQSSPSATKLKFSISAILEEQPPTKPKIDVEGDNDDGRSSTERSRSPDDDDYDESEDPESHAAEPSSAACQTWKPGFEGFGLAPSWNLELHRRLWSDRFAGRRVGHPYQSRAPPKHKKPRTSFTKPQIQELEQRFQDQKYLASTERATLAKDLNMSDAQVKTWFQNRRTKWRRQAAEEKEYERKTTARYFVESPYLASLANPPAYYARPDVAI